MTNEAKWAYATPVVLESSGASVANAAFSAAMDTTLSSANHSNYQYADFVLKCNGFGASLASSANGYVVLYRRDLNMATNSAADTPVQSSAYRGGFVGSFTVPNSLASTDTVYLPVVDVPLGEDQEFYIENLSTQTLAAGWALTCRPKTPYPSA